MCLYSVIIAVSVLAIAAFHVWVIPGDGLLWTGLGMVLLVSAGLLILDALAAFLIRRIPEGCIHYQSLLFRVAPWERKFYRRIRLKKWAHLIPELGGFTHFHKNTFGNPRDVKYVYRFILESCYGIAIHRASAWISLLVIVTGIFTPVSWRSVILPAAAVNTVLIYMPTLILRMNMPWLVHIYELNLKKSNM